MAVATAYPLALTALLDGHWGSPVSAGLMTYYVFAVLRQRRQPIIAVFRRFGDASIHRALSHLSAGTAALGRWVWLLDLSQAGARPDRGLQPFATLAALGGILGFGIASVVRYPAPEGILRALFLASAAMVWFSALAGVRGTLVLDFYLGIAATWGVVPALAAAGIESPQPWPLAALRVGVAVSVFFLLHRGINALMGRFPTITWRCRSWFFRNAVLTPRSLATLRAECSSAFRVWPRFLMNAPVRIHDILCEAQLWQPTVTTLLSAPATALAIIDVTNIDRESGLAWEIAECARLGVPMLFICRQERVETVQALLNGLISAPTRVLGWRVRPDNPDLIDNTSADALADHLIRSLKALYPDRRVRRSPPVQPPP